MEYKMIVLDLDGTLLTKDKKISPKTKQALIDIQKKGKKVVLASGRPFPGMEKYSQELQLDVYGGYVLSFNGVQILDCKSGKIISESSIPVEKCQQVYDLSLIHDTNLITYIDNKIYGEMYCKYADIETTINKMEFVEVDDLIAEIKKPVPKFIMLADGEYVEKILPLVTEELQNDFTVVRSEPYFLEILPKNVDKGTSLDRLGKLLNIKKEEIIACGDSYNDLTMIEYAGLGVAMENAREDAKNIADFITLSNENDGIAHVVEKFM